MNSTYQALRDVLAWSEETEEDQVLILEQIIEGIKQAE